MKNDKELGEQKQIFTDTQNQQNDTQKDATFDQRLGVLNLEKDPKNPEKSLVQSLVNGINKVPGLGTVADLTGYALRGVANLSHKIPYFGDKSKIKPNDFGDWNAQKQNMEKQTAILEPLAETGKLLKTIEGKCKLKDGTLDRTNFAKSAVNILSNDNNHDLLEEYLKGKKFEPEEITEAIKDVNQAKRILLTGEGIEVFQSTKTTPEEKNKEFIEFLGYKTEGEIELMSSKEIANTMNVLKKDFGFTLENDGRMTYKKPTTQSKNYRNELESANNINKKLEGKDGWFNYSEQNTESEEEKAEKEANNQTYSRTSTNTPQSGMSAKNIAGNAAVLGGAIASAAVIPFVGWIVALAILYSFKDKFKDDPKAEEELYKNVAKGLGEGGKNEEESKKLISDLQKQVAELEKRQSENKATPQDNIIKDLVKYLEKNPEVVDEITNILKEKDNKEKLKKFLEEKVYNGEATNEQKEAINNLINSGDANKTVKEVIKNIQESQEGLGKNVILKKDNKNNTQQNQENVNEGKKGVNTPKIYQQPFKNTTDKGDSNQGRTH